MARTDLARVLNENFDQMASHAAKSRSVVVKGTELAHFVNEVFSWHQINNERGEDILPTLLISNSRPSYFLENNHGYSRGGGLYRESENGDIKLVLVLLKRFCSTTT